MAEECKSLVEGIIGLIEREEEKYKVRRSEPQRGVDTEIEYELAMRELEREEMRSISMR